MKVIIKKRKLYVLYSNFRIWYIELFYILFERGFIYLMKFFVKFYLVLVNMYFYINRKNEELF